MTDKVYSIADRILQTQDTTSPTPQKSPLTVTALTEYALARPPRALHLTIRCTQACRFYTTTAHPNGYFTLDANVYFVIGVEGHDTLYIKPEVDGIVTFMFSWETNG